MKTKIHFKALLLIGIFFITLTGNAFGFDFNIDFGTSNGVPSNSYGAAAGQPGVWISPGIGTSTNIMDITGASTPVDITLNSSNYGGYTACTGDMGILLNDTFWGSSLWSILMDDLPNGVYDVYLYASTNSLVISGDMVVNGIPAASIPGSTLCNMAEGVDYAHVQATVSDGSLSITGSPVLFDGYYGLSGLQLTLTAPESTPEPIPTLSQWGMMILSLLLAGSAVLMINRKKKTA